MNPAPSEVNARTHQHERTAAGNHELALSSPLELFWGPIVVRIATVGDRRSLERLAKLDSTEMPIGATLIGELRGRPVAALSLGDGTAVADPFVATSDILELLRLRARQLGRTTSPPVAASGVSRRRRVRLNAQPR
jgi:hypothetical protein